jgi:hypothetical protein
VRGILALADVEADHKDWNEANRGWIRRARRGPGVVGGPEDTATAYFYDSSYRPYGRSWGAQFAPTANCGEMPSPEPSVSPAPSVTPTDEPTAGPVEPTDEPPEPTDEPTPEPPEPTEEPTPEPTQPPTEAPADDGASEGG